MLGVALFSGNTADFFLPPESEEIELNKIHYKTEFLTADILTSAFF